MKLKIKENRICPVCNSSFEAVKMGYNPIRKTCSEECHHKLSGISQKGRTLSEERKRNISKSLMGNTYSVGKLIGEKNPMYGKHRSEELKEKLRERLSGKDLSLERRKKMSMASKESWKNPNRKPRLTKAGPSQIHEEAVSKKLKELKTEGYRCILVNKVRPDIIAFKDNKIYSVEIERKNKNRAKKEYYETTGAINYYDDIMWVWLGKPKS